MRAAKKALFCKGHQYRAHVQAGYVVEYLLRLVMPLAVSGSRSPGALTCVDVVGAGDRDRTGMASLEGWGSTIELHPRTHVGGQIKRSRVPLRWRRPWMGRRDAVRGGPRKPLDCIERPGA
jgi:hypothetical protein